MGDQMKIQGTKKRLHARSIIFTHLDAFFLVINAPGRSAFNRVERRMALLSKELSGVLLEHEHFESHLDDRGNTIDPQLELKNFEHAGH